MTQKSAGLLPWCGSYGLAKKIMSRWVLLPSASHKRPRWREWIYEWKVKTWSASTSIIIIIIIQILPTSSIIPEGPLQQAPSRSPTVSISCKKACRNWRGGFLIWVSDLGLDTFGALVASFRSITRRRLQCFSHWDSLLEWTPNACCCAVLRGHIQTTGVAKAERVKQIGCVVCAQCIPQLFSKEICINRISKHSELLNLNLIFSWYARWFTDSAQPTGAILSDFGILHLSKRRVGLKYIEIWNMSRIWIRN